MANNLEQQNNNGFQGRENNDRISDLPDSLIQHILSFLPTKYVVPTAILSKRWKSLWIGVPSLDFDERGKMYSYKRFMNFVEKVLLLRDGSRIQRFRLLFSCYDYFNYSPFQSLIATVLSHKVQHLDITLFFNDHYSLPCSIFDRQSLSILKLSTYCTLELPSRISLPCLKVLHLCCFAFPNAESIENLFSCCPVLEELTLERCRLIHRNSITISIPSLKSLTICNSLEEDYPVDDHGCCIKVEAPALLSFNYTSRLISEFDLSKLSSIKKFQISLPYSLDYSRVQSLIAAAAAVSHEVQQLDITVCDSHQWTLPCSIFDCQTLSILKLSMKCTLDLPSRRISLPCLKVLQLSCFAFPNAESIEKLFSCCPVLEELTLSKCRLIHQNSVNISIPSLKSLTMVDSFEEHDLVDDPKSSYYIKLEAPSLLSFSINYNGFLTNIVPSINSCIQSAIAGAISHKLQMLDIDIHLCAENPFPLPYSIFDCQSLSILKLSMDNFTLELPDHISLPKLKVMHLHYLAFQNAKSTEKMFSCCPVLEELALQECKWMNLDSITISIPSLKILTIDDSKQEYDNSNCYIRIEAPALLSFNYINDCLANHLYLTDMSSSSSSIKACIHIPGLCFYRREEKACRLVKLLQGLENMVSLTISDEIAMVFSMTHPVSDLFPVFHRLEYLDLSMEVGGDFFEWLLKSLNFMPNLGTIQFSQGVDYTINKAGLWNMPKPPLPKCFLSSLKILGLGNVRGIYHEIFFLKYFLERAVSLQRINICQDIYISQHEHQLLRNKMEKHLSRFKHCAIIIQ